MPVQKKATLLPMIILLVVALLIFSPALVKWEPLTRLFSFQTKKQSVPKPDAKVWVNKQSGFYYCAGSGLYGKVQPGAYMSQGDAMQTGYRPIGNEPCR